MSSPPQPSHHFSFKVPAHKSSPIIHGIQPASSMSSSYGSIGQGFSSIKQDSPLQLSSSNEPQPMFGHNSYARIPRYQTSATRGHQSNGSMDSTFEGGMAVAVGDRPGSYQPPDSQVPIPSTPIAIPTRHTQYTATPAWEARNPPPLSSGSTAAHTNAMTPSSSRGTHYPLIYGFQVRGSYDSPSYQQLIPVTPQHVYATPTPASRRPPQLMTTPSIVAGFKPLPARQLPGPAPHPQFILPAPTEEPSRKLWQTSGEDVFFKEAFDAPGRYFLAAPPSPSKPSKEHRCPTCDKIFARPSALQTHQAVHTGAKPFQCPSLQCGKRFSVLSNMRRHIKTHDRSEPNRPSVKRRGMVYVSSDDYEGAEEDSEDLHSPVRMQFDIGRQGRPRRKRVPIPFDDSMLGNAGAIPAYQVSSQYLGFAN